MTNGTDTRAWYHSQKVMVFLIVLVLVTACLLALVLTGHLTVSPELVGAYLTAVAGTGSAVILGRAGEGIGASLGPRPRDE